MRDHVKKLECYSKWKKQLLFKSYLAERNQFVIFGGYELTCEKIHVGLPQGSVAILI